MNYQEIKNQQAPLRECFFAFSTKQYNEAIAEKQLEGKKIYSADYGMYGTKEGLEETFAFYKGLSARISKECSPQEVYNYEFDNHECDYQGDDREAMEICLEYFSADECSKIERKHAWATF